MTDEIRDAAEDYISTELAAELSGYSEAHLHRLAALGKIPGAVKTGRKLVVPRAWAEELYAEHKRSVTYSDAARAAGVSRQAIFCAVQHGVLTMSTRGRVTNESLAAYLEKRANSKK
ncbi:MAG: hypothetical protein Q4D58_11380 [Synergistaceae bacterium]|nr:hypothetical protein [Synergistaceae bacterium]